VKITVIATGFNREEMGKVEAAKKAVQPPPPTPQQRRDLDTPAFLRRAPSAAPSNQPALSNSADPGTTLHYAPLPDDLEIPTFLRRQLD
jgi:hypothetical protein